MPFSRKASPLARVYIHLDQYEMVNRQPVGSWGARLDTLAVDRPAKASWLLRRYVGRDSDTDFKIGVITLDGVSVDTEMDSDESARAAFIDLVDRTVAGGMPTTALEITVGSFRYMGPMLDRARSLEREDRFSIHLEPPAYSYSV